MTNPGFCSHCEERHGDFEGDLCADCTLLRAKEARSSTLRVRSAAQLLVEEEERISALDVQSAGRALMEAVYALARQEARRIDVPFLDATYHGCDSTWREALYAASDLSAVLIRDAAREEDV